MHLDGAAHFRGAYRSSQEDAYTPKVVESLTNDPKTRMARKGMDELRRKFLCKAYQANSTVHLWLQAMRSMIRSRTLLPNPSA